ncbi:hypothetical protein Esi_0168_0041 [Ectocarpus siliculosus]|uniref:Uncharacterized protein n=1 Tax=Ectocarpus siliculosus TaxID=2880 RepID=D8LGJ0_ECTSI|nr:hypothetical protein Esi_0168_0041 [Ectocarpus siliculosus]|eukprot:CBN79047.1 hypothetical protein Esi_0168_0041 [Ectocarpus siliculosus]
MTDGVGGWVMPEAGPDGEAKFKMTGPTGNCYDYSKARSGAYRFGLHPRSEGGEAYKRGRDADASDEAPAAKRCPKLSEEDIIAIFPQRLAELEKAEHEAARAKEVAEAAAAAERDEGTSHKFVFGDQGEGRRAGSGPFRSAGDRRWMIVGSLVFQGPTLLRPWQEAG